MKYFVPVVLSLIPLVLIFQRLVRAGRKRKGEYNTLLSKKKGEYEERKKQLQEIKERISFVEKEIKRVSDLYEIVKQMSKTLNWGEMLKLFKQAVKEYLNGEGFLFFTPDTENNFTLAAEEDPFFNKDWVKTHLTEFGKEKKMQIVRLNEETLLFLSLWREEELIGILWVRLGKVLESGSPEEREVLNAAETLRNQLVLGLEKAKLYTEVEKRSRFDGLTGLYRRYYFENRLREEIIRAKRYGGGFSIVLIDIDYFKKLNDNYGHQSGDQILRSLGRIIKESIYETDLAARYGGEEFVLLLPRAEPEGVKRKMESLREKIAREDFSLDWGKLKITVSLGLAHYPQNGAGAEEILRAADQALYLSKEKGRDRLSEYAEVLV